MKLTRDDRRVKALIVRPRGTQRILRPQRAERTNDMRQFQGGSRATLSIGHGSGMARGGGGGAASVARALASSAIPAAIDAAPEVFAPQPATPFGGPSQSPEADAALIAAEGIYGTPTAPSQLSQGVQSAMLGSSPGATLEQIVPGYTNPLASSLDPAAQERLRLARLARLEALGS